MVSTAWGVVTKAAVKMAATTLQGVRRWTASGRYQRLLAPTAARAMSTYVSVIGLHWKTDEAKLRRAFGEFGTLEKAELITPAHSETHLWAQLAYSKFDEALEAVTEMNGQELDGRLLRVSIVDPPQEVKEDEDK